MERPAQVAGSLKGSSAGASAVREGVSPLPFQKESLPYLSQMPQIRSLLLKMPTGTQTYP